MVDYGVAVIAYHDEDSGLSFVWHGGAYIDVCVGDEAYEVINVWNDEDDISDLEAEASENGPRRPFRAVLESFEARCRAWLAEADAEVEG